MSSPQRGTSNTADAGAYPIALFIQLGRNMIVQFLGITMASLVGLVIIPWPMVLGWMLIAAAAVGTEDHLLRVAARGGSGAARAARWSPAMRVIVTTVYALAAYVLISRGGPAERLFAVSLMSASMVHVLMRYYRSPAILVASLSPYLLILGSIGFSQALAALKHGNILATLTAPFAITLVAVQFWAARTQLAGVWDELMIARNAAEERERAAAAASRAKSQFLATMSHELRTPLNGVLGMAQALTADRLTHLQQERVHIIRRSSESLLAVLNDLLDLSKIEASAIDMEVAEFDLDDLVQGVTAAYAPMAKAKGVTFAVEAPEALAGRYLGDSARIRRVLYNLCDNAVKFTDAGQVTLQVERADGQMLFHVRDTGIGIANADLKHLFEGFFQADATLTRRHGGAGIGLAICRALATLMGGSLSATSVAGEGAAFTLALPLERVAAPQETTMAEPRAADPETPELRVLAAEDNPTNQMVLKALLGSAGVVPVITVNGREVTEAWEDGTWDIVLMDIQMPEMSGIEAARYIRRREAETGRARTPILAVTANAMTHQIAEYAAVGMDGVVAKPIDMNHLFAMMEQALVADEGVAASAQSSVA